VGLALQSSRQVCLIAVICTAYSDSPPGRTSSYTSVSPSNHTKTGPTALPLTSIPLPTASPSNATASSPSTAPTSTPSTFQLKTTGTSTSYLSVQPDLNGQDALLLSRYPSSATAFTLNPDGTLQSGGTFAGVYADVTDTILLMQTGALMGGSFNKSVCSVAGGELKCRTGANEKFFTCGNEGERFVEIGDEAGGMGDGCFGFELVVVPV